MWTERYTDFFRFNRLGDRVKFNTAEWIDTHHSRWPELAWQRMSTRSRHFWQSNSRLSPRMISRSLSSLCFFLLLILPLSSYQSKVMGWDIWFLSKPADVCECWSNKLLSFADTRERVQRLFFRLCFCFCYDFRLVELLSVFISGCHFNTALCFVSRQRPKLFRSSTGKQQAVRDNVSAFQVNLMCQFH